MHIDPEMGKAAFRMSLFIIVPAFGMLLLLKPGSPQFAVTVFTLIIGLLFLSTVIVLVRLFSR